jgi:hypothetical protein
LAFKCFFLILFAGRLPAHLPPAYLEETEGMAARPQPSATTEASARTGPPPQPTGDRAVQLLALLQRDGRLVDFLCEDIAGYPDDQVGAAVREVHAGCRAALTKYLGLEPVLPGEEGGATLVQAGFDPAAVKLVGRVTGTPPLRGVLRHKGWRASHVQLPPILGNQAAIVAPAEVEIE